LDPSLRCDYAEVRRLNKLLQLTNHHSGLQLTKLTPPSAHAAVIRTHTDDTDSHYRVCLFEAYTILPGYILAVVRVLAVLSPLHAGYSPTSIPTLARLHRQSTISPCTAVPLASVIHHPEQSGPEEHAGLNRPTGWIEWCMLALRL
jgi:hypothetical protein